MICPNCGYGRCPCCGRANYPRPFWPRPIVPMIPVAPCEPRPVIQPLGVSALDVARQAILT